MVARAMTKQRRGARVKVQTVKTRADHRAALTAIEGLINAKPGTAVGRRPDVLTRLVDGYESRHEAIEPPDPAAALLYYAESRGLTRPKETGRLRGKRNRPEAER